MARCHASWLWQGVALRGGKVSRLRAVAWCHAGQWPMMMMMMTMSMMTMMMIMMMMIMMMMMSMMMMMTMMIMMMMMEGLMLLANVLSNAPAARDRMVRAAAG